MASAKVDSSLFEETPGDGRRVRFRFPSRLMRFTAAERLALCTLFLAGIPIYLNIKHAHWNEWAIGGLLLIAPAFLSYRWMRLIWSRQDVIIDSDIEVIQVVERGPFSARVRNLPFAGFMGVTLITFENHTWAVALRHTKGQHIWLGMADRLVPVEELADRFASLSGLPVLAVKESEIPDTFAAAMPAPNDGPNRPGPS
jgi:hypothetical protein